MTPKRLLYIGNKLTKHGFTPTVIETLGPLLEKEGYSVIYSSDKKNLIIRLLDMVFKTMVHARQTDFILIDTYSTSSFYYALTVSQLCRLLGKKYIPILHGGNLPKRLDKNPYLSGLIFKKAFINVAPSNYLKSEFEIRGYENLVYIPNSINIEDYTFQKRELMKPRLLWVRSLAGIYNPKMAIKVLSLLQKEYPSASLRMVGPDKENLTDELKDYAESLGVKVEFTGKLSGEEWRKLSKQYDVFINTTHFDNTPVSVIEAMALGLPVVSTNVGGIPYLLKDSDDALLVADNNPEAMTKAIKKLLQKSELVNVLTTNARKKAESFDWEKVRQAWFEILASTGSATVDNHRA